MSEKKLILELALKINYELYQNAHISYYMYKTCEDKLFKEYS